MSKRSRTADGSAELRVTRSLRAIAAAVALGCAPIAFGGPDCRTLSESNELPRELVESSGVVVAHRDRGVFWTHNDDGSGLFAIDREGAIRASYRIRPRLRDWEDIAAGFCAPHGTCLYLADTGDNEERRRAGDARIVRVPEPDARSTTGGRSTLDGEVFPIRLPDGPRDIEALFVLPGERPYFVTKGRSHAVTVYRYPPPLRPDTVTLVEVQRLGPGPVGLGDQVTGASESLDGETIAIRTYQAVEFFRLDGDTLARIDDGLVNLRTLRESQGEGIGLGPDGLVVLTSEGGPFGGSPAMTLLRCIDLARASTISP